MDEVYQISSTEKVQQLEQELAAQLAELKAEIEDNRILQGIPSSAYSSVPIPKDASYFRKEREVIIKKSLQVAEAKPLVIQADVMQRELESCWRREYTAANLPLLLQQVLQHLPISHRINVADERCPDAVQDNWDKLRSAFDKNSDIFNIDVFPCSRVLRRNESCHKDTGFTLARHSIETEELKPQLQLLLSHFGVGYNLKDLKNSADEMELFSLVVQKFRSVFCKQQTMRTFPVYDAEVSRSENWGMLDPARALKKRANWIPFLKIKPKVDPWQQKLLIKLKQWKKVDKLMDLHSKFVEVLLVLVIYCQFWPFRGYAAGQLCLGWLLSSLPEKMAVFVHSSGLLCVRNGPEAPLTPHIIVLQMVAICEECGLVTKYDMFGFDQETCTPPKGSGVTVSDMERVMEGLQDHAAVVFETHHARSSSAASAHASGQQSYDHIWKKIYEFHQELTTEDNNTAVAHIGEDVGNISSSKPAASFGKKNERGYSYMGSSQLLGLEEGTTAHREHVVRRGAYLSLLFLRHLRLRELKRLCLGILNYFRSVERSLTISTSGLSFKAGHLIPSAEDTSWVSAAKGGTGAFGGLSSQPYVHYTPADYKVHSTQFMEFAEVENHGDFHTSEDGYIHTQDQRGVYIIYDVALEDLKELENQLLLVASQYIKKEKSKVSTRPKDLNILGWAHASVDRCAVLLDLWTCETAFLEKKCQLLDVYFEAYQHALDPEERFALAQAIIDIMHKRPRFDLKLEYFVNTYKDECICLQLHLQLLKDIVNQQIDAQREYLHKIWREGQRGGIGEFGLPYNVITKQLISLNTSRPTLKNIYLLEFHPSLGLVYLIPKALEYIYQEFYGICRPKTASKTSNLEKQVLQLVVDEWLTMEKPETFYNSQIQKDLFAEVLIEDPALVQEIALSLLEEGADEEKKTSREKQLFILDSFSMLLELAMLRHRLIEVSTESALLARLYKAFAMEAGFGEFHLYLRPMLFESASHGEKADHLPPLYITSLLEDDSCVDRYIPSSLPLSIQEIDSHIGKFSFRTRDGVMQLLCPSAIRNMQLILACQVIQKNALLVAVQQASFCYLVQPPRTLDIKDTPSVPPQTPLASPDAPHARSLATRQYPQLIPVYGKCPCFAV
ncbi:PREDICTED: transmembrane protein FLJ37396 [Charadrius vociferus]|uniref:transmembrane protein FLJ37396 n=1 Tax=Charadrius vociferus TaxID=50402 RepID=UPI0005217A1A|nr:PREDICTED: transmembrane protein FLJ37396 [Charadrius vociferus]